MENFLRDNKEKLFVWFDWETENLCLNECHNKPWELGLISYRNGKIEKEYHAYIKWPEGLNVSRQAAIITGFDPVKVQDLGKSPKEVLDVIDQEFNKADLICGHNIIGFDNYVTQAVYRKLGQTPYNIVPKMLDTFPIAKAMKLEIPYNQTDNFQAWQYRLYHRIEKGLKTSLGVMGKELKIDHNYNTLHQALADIHLNIKVWDKLKWMINIKE